MAPSLILWLILAVGAEAAPLPSLIETTTPKIESTPCPDDRPLDPCEAALRDAALVWKGRAKEENLLRVAAEEKIKRFEEAAVATEEPGLPSWVWPTVIATAVSIGAGIAIGYAVAPRDTPPSM